MYPYAPEEIEYASISLLNLKRISSDILYTRGSCDPLFIRLSHLNYVKILTPVDYFLNILFVLRDFVVLNIFDVKRLLNNPVPFRMSVNLCDR
jgi:hypothetical protein